MPKNVPTGAESPREDFQATKEGRPNKDKAKAPVTKSTKESRASHKAEKDAAKEARRNTSTIESSEIRWDSDDATDDNDELEDEGALVVDGSGNTVAKGSATDPDMVKMRAEKKAARNAKSAAVVPAEKSLKEKAAVSVVDNVGDEEDDDGPRGGEDADYDRTLVTLLAKQAAGQKLSNKERKSLKKLEERSERKVREQQESCDPLRAFSVSVAAGSGGDDNDDGATLSATDVIIHRFARAVASRSRTLPVESKIQG
jgi:hypothetical protein